MIQAFVAGNVVEGAAGTGFRVGGTVRQAGQSGIYGRPCAHGAGFQGDEQCAIGEVPGSFPLRGEFEREDFGMCGGVGASFPQIVGHRDDSLGIDHDRANRYFAETQRLSGGMESDAHVSVTLLRTVGEIKLHWNLGDKNYYRRAQEDSNLWPVVP